MKKLIRKNTWANVYSNAIFNKHVRSCSRAGVFWREWKRITILLEYSYTISWIKGQACFSLIRPTFKRILFFIMKLGSTFSLYFHMAFSPFLPFYYSFFLRFFFFLLFYYGYVYLSSFLLLFEFLSLRKFLNPFFSNINNIDREY